MPIDPALLRARAAEAAGRLTDPPACAAAVRQVLLDFADYGHRYSPRLAEHAPTNLYKTPALVVRAVANALRAPAAAAPEAALAVARLLWADGQRETRRLAAEVAGIVMAAQPAAAAAQVEAWLPEVESGETAAALAELGLAPLLTQDPYAALQRAQGWLGRPQPWARRTGVAVVQALARDRRWDDVPAALEALRGLMGERDAGVRQAVGEALRGLAGRHPAAVIQFLREFARRQDHNTQLILRAVLRSLPAGAQAELTRLMRT